MGITGPRLEGRSVWDSRVADDGDRPHRVLLTATRTPDGSGRLEVAQVYELEGRSVPFTRRPQEQAPAPIERFGRCSTRSVLGPSPLGPWDLTAARPSTAEPDLFAAPLVRLRDGSRALLGFRDLEAESGDAFEIIDPIPVVVRDGALAALTPR